MATPGFTPTSLLSGGRYALAAAKHELSRANIPGALAAAVERGKDLASDSLPKATVQMLEVCKANPAATIACGVASVSTLLVAAPAAVAGPALAAAGFGTNGIISGSAAAGIQSAIGNVVAPSLFAGLQSAGAGGYGVAAVCGTLQVAGVVTSSVAGFVAWTKAKL